MAQVPASNDLEATIDAAYHKACKFPRDCMLSHFTADEIILEENKVSGRFQTRGRYKTQLKMHEEGIGDYLSSNSIEKKVTIYKLEYFEGKWTDEMAEYMTAPHGSSDRQLTLYRGDKAKIGSKDYRLECASHVKSGWYLSNNQFMSLFNAISGLSQAEYVCDFLNKIDSFEEAAKFRNYFVQEFGKEPDEYLET
jgi:hypothetical protein